MNDSWKIMSEYIWTTKSGSERKIKKSRIPNVDSFDIKEGVRDFHIFPKFKWLKCGPDFDDHILNTFSVAGGKGLKNNPFLSGICLVPAGPYTLIVSHNVSFLHIIIWIIPPLMRDKLKKTQGLILSSLGIPDKDFYGMNSRHHEMIIETALYRVSNKTQPTLPVAKQWCTCAQPSD